MRLERISGNWCMRPLAAVAMILSLTGCESLGPVRQLADEFRESFARGSDEPVVLVDLPPAPRPVYHQGQVFVYGKARLRQVSAVKDDLIVWGNRNGELYRTTGDFFLPRVYQKSDERVVLRRFGGDPGALWPLAVGKRASFTEYRSTFRGQGAAPEERERRWTCEVDDARITRVYAGGFETYRVTCRSYRANPLSLRAHEPLLVITWDYAPQLGHYVRREWVQRNRGKRVIHELSAAMPASLATPQRLDAVLRRLRKHHP